MRTEDRRIFMDRLPRLTKRIARKGAYLQTEIISQHALLGLTVSEN
jgi:hypothetical protein